MTRTQKAILVLFLGLLVGCQKDDLGSPMGKYLMAFETCNRSDASRRCTTSGQYHSVYLAQSNDGTSWGLVPQWTPYAETSPAAIRRDGNLYLYGDSSYFRRYDLTTGVLTKPLAVQMTRQDNSQEYFANPYPVINAQGLIVLFYLVGNNIGQDPTTCATGPCTQVFRTATEVLGSDGGTFAVDSGDRAQVTLATGETASQPSLVTSTAGNILLVGNNSNVLAFLSATLTGTYSPVSLLSGGILVNGVGAEPTGFYNSTLGEYWTYVSRTMGDGTIQVLQARHGTLGTPLDLSHFTSVLSAQALGLAAGYTVENPSFTLNQ